MPALLIVPLITFALAISSVRTRRSASATALLGTVLTLLLTLLVAWGIAKRSVYVATYQYINLSVAFSGPTNFQTFAVNIVLRVDHFVLAAMVAMVVCVFAVLGWHQFMGRSEPGAARFHAVVTALMFASTGILLSQDLATLFGFWLIGGSMTYLLLAHRWGQEEPAVKARVALALPFFTDLSLLSGIAVLYSRFGAQDLSTLAPILHPSFGVGEKSLVVAAVLVFIGVAGRLALFPFTSWITQTATSAPTAASAIVQSVWSIAGIAVLYRFTPIFAATNPRTMQVLLVACIVAAILAALLALAGTEPRRSLAFVGSAAVAVSAAVVMNAPYHNVAVLGIAGAAAVLALAPARAGALLAISTIANAMRTDDLLEMGDAWRRMRTSSAALLVCSVVLGLSATGALAYGVSSRSKTGLALGEAVLLLAVGALHLFYAVSIGPLRRRRAFDPDRVREQPGGLGWPYWLAVTGAAFLVVSLFPAALDYLGGGKHNPPSIAAFAVWAAVPVLGFAACSFAFFRSKDGALAASAWAGDLVARRTALVFGLVDRFLVAPVTDIARRIGDWIPEGDAALGRFATASGQLALAAVRAPVLPTVILLAIVLAVIFALAAPGIVR